MKKGMLLFMLLIAMTVYSQDKKTNEYRELIDSAISIVSNEYHKFYNEDLNNYNPKDIIIYVVDENDKRINLDNVKSKFTLRTIDIDDRKNRKLLKKGLKVWKVKPTLNGNIITVNVINFSVNYKGKMYHFVNGGGSTVFFQYSCEEEKWILSKVEHSSI